MPFGPSNSGRGECGDVQHSPHLVEISTDESIPTHGRLANGGGGQEDVVLFHTMGMAARHCSARVSILM
jgi:hypothetical protein